MSRPTGRSDAGVSVSEHPVVRHKIALLRDRRTEPIRFRALVTELATALTYDATRDLALAPRAVDTPLTSVAGERLRDPISLVPILRAGLGMVEGAWRILPQACVWHYGVRRDEITLAAEEYYCGVPASATGEEKRANDCIVLDPMLATGGSAIKAVDALRRHGAMRIRFVGLLGAPEGVAALRAAHPDVAITLAALDERLTGDDDDVPNGFIWPGLGDAGDRQFRTFP